MSTCRIALANLRYPETPDESVTLAENAIAQAVDRRAGIICFPECFVPGYRAGKPILPPDSAFLEAAWSSIAAAAAKANMAVVLGTERPADHKSPVPDPNFPNDRIAKLPNRITVLVINPDGTTAGFQDKVQLDPSEEGAYSPGSGRKIFNIGPMTFGISICHEGWRYPETVRWAAQRGAQLVFHPHFGEPEPGGYVATSFADPANTFHEKAILCRAAENTCYVASVNCAIPGSPTTSAVASPDGSLLCYQPYGKEGLLIADLDLTAASGFLAQRCKYA